MARSRITAQALAVIAGVGALAQSASAQWNLLTVSNTNTLMLVDLSSGPAFTATPLGVTRDANSGPVRRIRGLAFAGSTLYGMTREGDLVSVNPNTGETGFLHSVASTGAQFWSDLTYDATTNSLYTVNPFGDQSLVRIDILGPNSFSHTVQGPTQFAGTGNNFQMLGVEFLNNGTLVAANRSNDNIVEMDPTNGSFMFTWGSVTSGVTNAQQIAVHPGTGALWGIHDHFSSSNNAALSIFDASFQSIELGELPFGIVENVGGGADTYGWGGIAFVPVPSPCAASLLGLATLASHRRRRAP